MATNADLPVLSPPRIRALALLADSTANPVEIAGVAASDPALTALVLRAANSAFSAPRQSVTRVHDAIVRIGLRETRQIVGAAVLKRAFRNLAKAGIDEDEAWRHVILCALLAEGVANHEPHTPIVRDSAFAAGLLHNIGRLQKASSDPRSYRLVVDLVRQGAESLDAEREVFGSDHLAWGDSVAQACRLPAEIRRAITTHHQEPPSDDPLGAAVARAHQISFELGVGNGLLNTESAPGELSRRDHGLVAALGGAEALLLHIESFRNSVA